MEQQPTAFGSPSWPTMTPTSTSTRRPTATITPPLSSPQAFSSSQPTAWRNALWNHPARGSDADDEDDADNTGSDSIIGSGLGSWLQWLLASDTAAGVLARLALRHYQAVCLAVALIVALAPAGSGQSSPTSVLAPFAVDNAQQVSLFLVALSFLCMGLMLALHLEVASAPPPASPTSASPSPAATPVAQAPSSTPPTVANSSATAGFPLCFELPWIPHARPSSSTPSPSSAPTCKRPDEVEINALAESATRSGSRSVSGEIDGPLQAATGSDSGNTGAFMSSLQSLRSSLSAAMSFGGPAPPSPSPTRPSAATPHAARPLAAVSAPGNYTGNGNRDGSASGIALGLGRLMMSNDSSMHGQHSVLSVGADKSMPFADVQSPTQIQQRQRQQLFYVPPHKHVLPPSSLSSNRGETITIPGGWVTQQELELMIAADQGGAMQLRQVLQDPAASAEAIAAPSSGADAGGATSLSNSSTATQRPLSPSSQYSFFLRQLLCSLLPVDALIEVCCGGRSQPTASCSVASCKAIAGRASACVCAASKSAASVICPCCCNNTAQPAPGSCGAVCLSLRQGIVASVSGLAAALIAGPVGVIRAYCKSQPHEAFIMVSSLVIGLCGPFVVAAGLPLTSVTLHLSFLGPVATNATLAHGNSTSGNIIAFGNATSNNSTNTTSSGNSTIGVIAGSLVDTAALLPSPSAAAGIIALLCLPWSSFLSLRHLNVELQKRSIVGGGAGSLVSAAAAIGGVAGGNAAAAGISSVGKPSGGTSASPSITSQHMGRATLVLVVRMFAFAFLSPLLLQSALQFGESSGGGSHFDAFVDQVYGVLTRNGTSIAIAGLTQSQRTVLFSAIGTIADATPVSPLIDVGVTTGLLFATTLVPLALPILIVVAYRSTGIHLLSPLRGNPYAYPMLSFAQYALGCIALVVLVASDSRAAAWLVNQRTAGAAMGGGGGVGSSAASLASWPSALLSAAALAAIVTAAAVVGCALVPLFGTFCLSSCTRGNSQPKGSTPTAATGLTGASDALATASATASTTPAAASAPQATFCSRRPQWQWLPSAHVLDGLLVTTGRCLSSGMGLAAAITTTSAPGSSWLASVAMLTELQSSSLAAAAAADGYSAPDSLSAGDVIQLVRVSVAFTFGAYCLLHHFLTAIIEHGWCRYSEYQSELMQSKRTEVARLQEARAQWEQEQRGLQQQMQQTQLQIGGGDYGGSSLLTMATGVDDDLQERQENGHQLESGSVDAAYTSSNRGPLNGQLLSSPPPGHYSHSDAQQISKHHQMQHLHEPQSVSDASASTAPYHDAHYRGHPHANIDHSLQTAEQNVAAASHVAAPQQHGESLNGGAVLQAPPTPPVAMRPPPARQRQQQQSHQRLLLDGEAGVAVTSQPTTPSAAAGPAVLPQTPDALRDNSYSHKQQQSALFSQVQPPVPLATSGFGGRSQLNVSSSSGNGGTGSGVLSRLPMLIAMPDPTGRAPFILVPAHMASAAAMSSSFASTPSALAATPVAQSHVQLEAARIDAFAGSAGADGAGAGVDVESHSGSSGGGGDGGAITVADLTPPPELDATDQQYTGASAAVNSVSYEGSGGGAAGTAGSYAGAIFIGLRRVAASQRQPHDPQRTLGTRAAALQAHEAQQAAAPSISSAVTPTGSNAGTKTGPVTVSTSSSSQLQQQMPRPPPSSSSSSTAGATSSKQPTRPVSPPAALKVGTSSAATSASAPIGAVKGPASSAMSALTPRAPPVGTSTSSTPTSSGHSSAASAVVVPRPPSAGAVPSRSRAVSSASSSSAASAQQPKYLPSAPGAHTPTATALAPKPPPGPVVVAAATAAVVPSPPLTRPKPPTAPPAANK